MLTSKADRYSVSISPWKFVLCNVATRTAVSASSTKTPRSSSGKYCHHTGFSDVLVRPLTSHNG